MAFRFKQFIVEDDRSTLRVGTDSMLLGSWADPGKAGRILDIGTGCGVLALMMAQKSIGLIEAIETDEPSLRQAAMNFGNSPWPERIRAIHCSLEEFSLKEPGHFDFIITNPPFFERHLKSSSKQVNVAKHDTGLTLETLVRLTKSMVSATGRFCLIYPFAGRSRLLQCLEKNGFSISREMHVKGRPESGPGRILIECTPLHCENPLRSVLNILGDDGKYTDDYLDLTNEYHSF